MNETKNPFEVRPLHVAMAQSAMADFKRYAYGRSDTETMDALLDEHLKHVHKLVQAGLIDPQAGSMIVTDIPTSNLSVVDAHFPSLNERQVSIFTREGVKAIISLLQRPEAIVQH